MQRNEKKKKKKKKKIEPKISVLIKNGSIYVCKKKNYLSRKYKNPQFSMSNKWKASKREIYGAKCVIAKEVTGALG